MLLVGLPEARAARILAECTSLGSIVCSKLSMLVKRLPMNVDPADVEGTEGFCSDFPCLTITLDLYKFWYACKSGNSDSNWLNFKHSYSFNN